MPFIFPTSQKQAKETAGQILSYGFAKEVLGTYCLNTLHIQYDKLHQIEMIEGDATRIAKQTLDDARIAVENLYGEIAGLPDNQVPSGTMQARVNGYIYMVYNVVHGIDVLVGGGWAAELIDIVGYAWNKTFGTVIDRAVDTLDAASKIPQTGLSSVGDILKSLGKLGYVAMAGILILAIAVAASLATGKVPK